MQSGTDMIGQAQTGTGKTFAYGIPVLLKTTYTPFETLILCPTRELSIQVSRELKKLVKLLSEYDELTDLAFSITCMLEKHLEK